MFQSLTPQALRLLSREIVTLRNDPPEGVRIVVDEDDLTNMEGWVQGPCKWSHSDFECGGVGCCSVYNVNIVHPCCHRPARLDWSSLCPAFGMDLNIRRRCGLFVMPC
jgi:hypothetical protein